MHQSMHKSGDIFATSATTYKLSCCWIQLLIVFSSENSPPSNVVVYTQAVDPIISLIGHGMPNMTILLQRPTSSIDNDYLSTTPLLLVVSISPIDLYCVPVYQTLFSVQ